MKVKKKQFHDAGQNFRNSRIILQQQGREKHKKKERFRKRFGSCNDIKEPCSGFLGYVASYLETLVMI